MKEKNIKKQPGFYLGAFLVSAGCSHLTIARKAFKAQVPDWVPL